MNYLLYLCLIVFSVGCTLVNQSLPNQPPSLEGAMIDTRQVGRGQPVRLQIVASDEDGDPLVYRWQAYQMDSSVFEAVLELSPDGLLNRPGQLRSFYGFLALATPAGGFTDSTAHTLNTWVAPLSIQGSSEHFLLTVTVRDRDCSVITDTERRAACLTDDSQFIQIHPVEVTQRPPTVELPADTTVAFAEPELALLARVHDPDGDELQVEWSQTAGAEMPYTVLTLLTGDSQLIGVPLHPGEYAFSVLVCDGAESATAGSHVTVEAGALPPGGDMVQLELPDGHTYSIDRYEYPNESGTVPQLTDSWFQAARLCTEQGKRLCTPEEWIHACQGSQRQPYSSLDDPTLAEEERFGYRFCNTTGSEDAGAQPSPATHRAPSGTYSNCHSDYGVYDMTGNVREWVAGTMDDGSTSGGLSESSVQDAPPELNPCSAVTRFPSLPAGWEILSPAAASELPPELTEYYLQNDVGFRCCR